MAELLRAFAHYVRSISLGQVRDILGSTLSLNVQYTLACSSPTEWLLDLDDEQLRRLVAILSAKTLKPEDHVGPTTKKEPDEKKSTGTCQYACLSCGIVKEFNPDGNIPEFCLACRGRTLGRSH